MSKNAKDLLREEKLAKQHRREFERKIKSLKKFAPRTDSQATYCEDIRNNSLVFGIGPAGTGKSFCAVRCALEELAHERVSKLYITRPIIEAGGEEIGTLPGGIDEKLYPYFYPIQDSVELTSTGGNLFENQIEIAPLAFMRGRTFWDCVVILDEAQNTTPAQMKMFLTRIGENCKAIINGDITQKDIEGVSGLEVAIEKLEGMKNVAICEFTEADIVRSSLVRNILKRWDS